MGRPKIEIDADEVVKLASFGCTTQEIASFFDCSADTVTGRFSEQLAKGKDEGKIRLRKAQIALALKGNATMLIWLGKQYLGQSDKIENTENIYLNEKIEFMSEQDVKEGREALNKYLLN